MTIVDLALHGYAKEHDGSFPNAQNGSAALELLYPNHVVTGKELAGLTGDQKRVVAALISNQSISNFTSWVYVPGFRSNDDPRLAILWESSSQVRVRGLSFQKTRPVLLLDHEVTNVLVAEWDSFMQLQEALRTDAVKRKSEPDTPTNAPAVP
jgi:hypothetical protein